MMKMEEIHMKDPSKGYRRINDDLYRKYSIKINDKRALQICRTRDIKSTIKYANHGCTRRAALDVVTRNILTRTGGREYTLAGCLPARK